MSLSSCAPGVPSDDQSSPFNERKEKSWQNNNLLNMTQCEASHLYLCSEDFQLPRIMKEQEMYIGKIMYFVHLRIKNTK